MNYVQINFGLFSTINFVLVWLTAEKYAKIIYIVRMVRENVRNVDKSAVYIDGVEKRRAD